MKGVFIFAGGAVTGALVSFFVTKHICEKKYSAEFNEEINKFKESYIPKTPVEVKKETKTVELKTGEEPQIAVNAAIDYSSIVKKYSEMSAEIVVDDKPHHTSEDCFVFINSSLFASLDGYEKVDLVLYSDGKLASEHDYELVDPAFTCGDEAVDILARGDADEIYVRNEMTNIEYAISISDSTYADATGIYSREDD